MLAQHRLQLAGMTEAELPQQRPQSGGAYTPSNRTGIPPARSTSKSSMLSAPEHIPAITPSSLGTGFAALERTRDILIDTFSAMISGSRVCSASPSSGTSPA